MVLAVACGNSGEEPGLLGLNTGIPDASTTATATATATTTSKPVTTDSGTVDSGPACPTVDSLLGSYGLASTCGPCIDTSCTPVLDACNADCSCPTAAVGYVQCISLGANSATCSAVAVQATNAQTVYAVLECTQICQDECHQAGDAGDDDDSGDGGDAGATTADGGSDASR